MKSNEKWKQNRTFLRDWRVVNERLVVRGEFLLDLDWTKNWDKELEEMNKCKKGHPYEFPESLIYFQAVLNQWVNYRGIEGVTRKIENYDLIPKHNDYSSAFRRIKKMAIGIERPEKKKVSTTTDGSGIKMNSAGEYRQDKYGNKGAKNYLRVVITADPFTKDLLDCDVHVDGEGNSEPEIAVSHLEKLLEESFEIEKFWGDGAFDVKDLFNFLQKHGILSAIKIRKNASGNADGSMRRAREVKEYKKKGYKKWAQDKHYGRRWTGTEVIFSAVKGIFGERTRAKTIPNMIKEVKRRFWAYQRMKRYAEARVPA
jgi:hypothetical protein